MANTNSTTIGLLKKYNFPIQKKYGQNFLIDDNILDGIVRAAEVSFADMVLEIGPGLGALTGYLCRNAGHVIAVEVDKMLIPILQESLAHYDNLTLINEDVLKLDLSAVISGVNQKTASQPETASQPGTESQLGTELQPGTELQSEPAAQPEEQANPQNSHLQPEDCLTQSADTPQPNTKIKVVANLPYYITTPVIMELLEKQSTIQSITVMIQKEVAERIQVGPGNKHYGALSLAVQYYAKPQYIMTVSRNCFLPKPEVDSAVIRLDVYDPEDRPVKAADSQKMFRIIRAAFNQRRKTLVNALSNAQNLEYSKERIAAALSELGLSETVRGEALSLAQFAALSDRL